MIPLYRRKRNSTFEIRLHSYLLVSTDANYILFLETVCSHMYRMQMKFGNSYAQNRSHDSALC